MIKYFFSDTNIQVPAVTTKQMREIDSMAVEETGPALLQMMENAGRNLAQLAMEGLGEHWREAKIVVLAGTGGNGGGGICAARHLANHNLNVRLCLSAPNRLRKVPAYQRHIFASTLGKEVEFADLRQEAAPDLILDALLGYSLQAAPKGEVVELIRWANDTKAPIISLDVPSGVDSTTGETPGDFINAQITMTLALPKTGLLPEKTGNLVLADIGIPEDTYHRLGLSYTSPFGNRFRVPLSCQINLPTFWKRKTILFPDSAA